MMLLLDSTSGAGSAPPNEAADLPIRRATVDQIVAHRNRALTLYADAHAAIGNASAALESAQEEALKASPGENRFNYHIKIDEAKFIASIKVPDYPDFMGTARKIVDTNVWSYVIRLTDLERLMDRKAKDEFYQQLITDVPEATVENICATLEKFMLDAGTIWKRGIAECFSNLDRRFRSHDGWKIGSRIILDRAFNEYGSWNWHRDQGATMLDVERVFRILDEGVGAALRGYGIQHQIDAERRHGHGPRQTTVETEYFRVRIYKNGNAHLWFLRDDLVERVNQLLGEYYGAPIPEDREPDEDTGLFDAKTLPAKRYGFFPTPDDTADRVIRCVPIYRHAEEPALTILEPSAGTGNLARRCVDSVWNEWDDKAKERVERSVAHQVDCVEIQPDLADSLSAEGIYRKVYGCNFLSLSPVTTGPYDRVIMNPPFDRERDIDHVMHALDFLKPDGCLVAIMSAGTEFRETRKSVAFRALMKSMNARFDDLPAGSFASVGTYCNTIVLKVWKNGRGQSGDSEVRRRFE